MQQQYPYANVAQGLASLGRGEDTMLMHITPEEFQDFNEMAQAAGFEHIPINPYTGLPEYGFGKAFKSVRKSISKVVKSVVKSPIASTLLPIAAGAILPAALPTLFTSPLITGTAVGGITALATGDVMKGLSAGLGAYGGYGLGKGLGAMGTNISGGITDLAPSAYNTGMLGVGPTSGVPLATTAGTYAPASLTEHLGNMATGVESLFTEPSRAFSELRTALGTQVPGTEASSGQLTGVTRDAAGNIISTTSTPPSIGTAGYIEPASALEALTTIGGPALQVASAAMAPELDQPLTQEEIEAAAGVNYIPGGRTLNLASEDSGLRLYDNLPDTGIGTSTMTQGPVASYYTPEELRELYEMSKGISYAKEGGVMKLASGRYLKGDGDGMSDNIKATIEGKQEARLSDGEFVIPADVVSHLGNGSSDAGAAKLYTMMDRIRKARTGKESQARQIQPQRFMPA